METQGSLQQTNECNQTFVNENINEKKSQNTLISKKLSNSDNNWSNHLINQQNATTMSQSQSLSSEDTYHRSLFPYSPMTSLKSSSYDKRAPFNFPSFYQSNRFTRNSFSRYSNENPSIENTSTIFPLQSTTSYMRDDSSQWLQTNMDIGLTNIKDRSIDTVCDYKKCYYVFEIQFKRSNRLCMGSEDDSAVDIGDYVCVTGDRGVDLGKVIKRKPCINLVSQQPMPIVLNKASQIEISLLKDQRREEKCVIRLCTQKAKQHNMDLVIVDAEFQYDRKKLTIYYYSNCRIDFRIFVKELYSIYYARIWMENIKTSIKSYETDSK